MKSSKSGFTLVEVMITVSIIALLASILIPNLLRARVEANDAAAQANLKNISTAMENYLATNNNYPPDITTLLTASPPYLQVDYFTGVHSGYTFTINSLTSDIYSITATPYTSNVGSGSFTISTGSVLEEN